MMGARAIFERSGCRTPGSAWPGTRLAPSPRFLFPPDRERPGELFLLRRPLRILDGWEQAAPFFPDASGWLVSDIDGLLTFVSMLLGGEDRGGMGER